jgi:hypothetical protein
MNRLKDYLSSGNYFIIFISLSIAINVVSFSVTYFSLTEIIIFILSLWAGIYIFYRSLVYVIKDYRKSGLIFILIFCPIVYYNNIYSVLFSHSFLGNFIDNKPRFLFIALPLISLVLIYIIHKSKKILTEITGLLNLFFLISLFIVTFSFISGLAYNEPEKIIPSFLEYQNTNKQTFSNDTTTKRDIYFLIFDAYTGIESLKKYWNYDNNELLNSLKKYNFSVYEGARSNYDFTGFSITSTLNMDYFDTLIYSKNIEKTVSSCFKLIKKCCVTDFLVSKSYKIINISPFDLNDQKKYYDQNYFNSETDNIYRYFYKTTAMMYFYNRFFGKKMNEINIQLFDELNKTISDTIHPKFVYAHIMMPHDPYLFDKNGNLLSQSEQHRHNNDRDKNLYFQQLQFANKKIIDFLDLLFSVNASNPIIIIQGDHGFRHLNKEIYGYKENHSILFAIHAPDLNPPFEANEITGVNLFRTIFNNYFGTKYPLLPHIEYFYPSLGD